MSSRGFCYVCVFRLMFFYWSFFYKRFFRALGKPKIYAKCWQHVIVISFLYFLDMFEVVFFGWSGLFETRGAKSFLSGGLVAQRHWYFISVEKKRKSREFSGPPTVQPNDHLGVFMVPWTLFHVLSIDPSCFLDIQSLGDGGLN